MKEKKTGKKRKRKKKKKKKKEKKRKKRKKGKKKKNKKKEKKEKRKKGKKRRKKRQKKRKFYPRWINKLLSFVFTNALLSRVKDEIEANIFLVVSAGLFFPLQLSFARSIGAGRWFWPTESGRVAD